MSSLPLIFFAIYFRVEAPFYSSACRVILPLHRQSQGSPQSGSIPYRFHIPSFGAPIARSEPSEERKLELGQWFCDQEGEGWKPAVVREHLHQHSQVRDEGERFKSRNDLGNILSIGDPQLFPLPASFIISVHYTSDPLDPLGSCIGLREAQGVLEYTALASTVANPGESAIPDLVGLIIQRPQMFLEDYPHRLRIASYLELRKTRVRQGKHNPYVSFPAASRPGFGSWS